MPVPLHLMNTYSTICSVTLVSTDSVPSEDQVQCLVEWTMGGGAGGREVTIGGVTQQVSRTLVHKILIPRELSCPWQSVFSLR